MNVTNTTSIITVSAIAVILFFFDVTGIFVGPTINSFCGIYFIRYLDQMGHHCIVWCHVCIWFVSHLFWRRGLLLFEQVVRLH